MKVFGSYTDKDYIAFLMKPVADCNLHDFLRKPGGLKDRDRHSLRNFFGCLAGAVNYLHNCKIRHRDLSARNILIHQGAVYISDLGSAHKWTSTATQGSMTQDRHVPMSVEYMAPEIAKRAPRSSSSDMWSLGVVFLEMATLLVGRTLDQFHAAIVKEAGRNLEPYIWANPRVVNVWVSELQRYNKGPMHDNEPLVWIRDLLDEFPNNRPKSRGLMQDILECPSFEVFCCINCQPEFRDRSFEYGGLRPIPEMTMDNSQNVRNDVANIFRNNTHQSPVMSPKTSSSIETWLAGTEVMTDQWSSPIMPGSFTFDDAPVAGTYVESSGSRLITVDAVEDDETAQPEITPPPPPLPVFELMGDVRQLSPLDESIQLLSDADLYPSLPSIEPGKPLRARKGRLEKPRDTGLGFLECESPDSSDDGDTKRFNEADDSSGSETDSDVTIQAAQALEVRPENIDNGACPVPWSLPNFAGEDMSWIQSLNNLPEDLDEEQNQQPHLPLPRATRYEWITSSTTEVLGLRSHDVGIEITQKVPSEDPEPHRVESVVVKPMYLESELFTVADATDVPHVDGQLTRNSIVINDTSSHLLPLAGSTNRMSADLTEFSSAEEAAPTTTPRPSESHSSAQLPSPPQEQAPDCRFIPLQRQCDQLLSPTQQQQEQFDGVIPPTLRVAEGSNPTRPWNTAYAVGSRQEVQELPGDPSPKSKQTEKAANTDLLQAPRQPCSMTGVSDAVLSVAKSSQAPLLQEPLHIVKIPESSIPTTVVQPVTTVECRQETSVQANKPIETVPEIQSKVPKVVKQRKDSVMVADTRVKPSLKLKDDAPTKPRFRLQKSPTGFEEHQDKLSVANMASLNGPLPDPKRFEPKKREHGPGISASDYIQDTWESASSVATSVMSERTKGILKGVSLNKWLDKDHRLLETFCAKGNVQAVRVLLSKGCNPGKSEGSKQGRRIGPIVNAVQGASLKHNKCVRELIENNVDVNVRSRKSGKTPLHLAIENPYFVGYEHLIRDLIEAGANTNKADFKDDRPIMKIFYGNDTGPLEDYRRRALALLLRVPEIEVDIVLPGTLNTPLHLAVRRKDPYAVGMLLYKKANVNAKNASGSTPLLLTANQFQSNLTKDHVTLLKLLLETEGIAVDEQAGVNEQTALHYAVKAGAPAAVELLLAHGASPHCKDSAGQDALVLAMQTASGQPREDHIEIMARLCDSMGITWPPTEGICVLEMACKDVDGILMETLLGDGLEPNLKKNKRPIMQRSIGYGNSKVVKMLTHCGAFVDLANEEGQDAVVYAVRKGEDEIAAYLVREGNYQREGSRVTPERLQKLIAERGIMKT